MKRDEAIKDATDEQDAMLRDNVLYLHFEPAQPDYTDFQ